MRRWFHILFVLPLLLVTGCKDVLELEKPASGLVLTVCCEDPSLTKSTPEEGETRFNENLIKSVDFFFYPGETPDEDAKAVYHHREDLDEDPVKHTGDKWEATFTLVLPRVVAEQIFIAEKDLKATVYAVVNYNGEPLTSTSSLSELGDIAIVTDFAATERDFIQNNFLMDGKTVITYNESASTSASGTIYARRFAAKMTTAISVANQVNLKSADNQAEEIWVPVLHTMRIYLVDGAKNVTLGTESSKNNTSPEYFTYSDQRRPFLKDNGETYLSTTPKNPELGEKVYYNTYPMYSYPVKWSNGKPDYTQPLPAQPYLKLEMDWRRKEENGYSYDRRKYYYKVILPTSSLERNNWYHFNIDVSILGSESDEDKAYLFPTTYYILDWQNKDVPIDKYAVISKARYLSVDTKIKTLNNLAKLSIPFLSSHDVKIVEGTVKARRPFYGVIKEGVAEQDEYSSTYHAWVRKNDDDESYYLDYCKTFEAFNYVSNVVDNLHDYAVMMSRISLKFDKYPRHLLTTHQIAVRNYNRLKQVFDEEAFKKRINHGMEKTFGEYRFYYPESTQAIKDEAVSQNNCVASYISRVIDGNCDILFLRKRAFPEESLVTIEVQNGKIVQAKQKFNDPVTKKQQDVINQWNEWYSKKSEQMK